MKTYLAGLVALVFLVSLFAISPFPVYAARPAWLTDITTSCDLTVSSAYAEIVGTLRKGGFGPPLATTGRMLCSDSQVFVATLSTLDKPRTWSISITINDPAVPGAVCGAYATGTFPATISLSSLSPSCYQAFGEVTVSLASPVRA